MAIRLPLQLCEHAREDGTESLRYLVGRDDTRCLLRSLDGALGFELEPFGGDTVRLTRAAETVTDPEGAFLGARRSPEGRILAKALACRGSTKFGESLARDEMVHY